MNKVYIQRLHSAMTTKPKSFAKSMENNTKRLIQHKHHQPDASSLPHRKKRLSTYSATRYNVTDVANSISSSVVTTDRLCEKIMYEKDNEEVNCRHTWRSPIGTIADHRMTNNNRIRKQWHIFTFVFLPLILCVVQVTVVNGHPDPAPVRVSHSYTKTVSNTIPTSTTSRSTTQMTSFLPSDAISSLSSSVINSKNYNTFASNRSGSSISSSTSSFKTKNVSSGSSNINNNANIQPSSRRLASANVNREDFSPFPATSIDRPFYTKITTNDAVATPSYYKRAKGSSKKRKKSKNSSKASSFAKYSKTKGSKEQDSDSSTSVEEIDNDEYAFMPQTTEKSYHPPKLSLEPFFNFLTSLATASREVIMSKEQYHHNNQHQTEASSPTTTSDNNKYSTSYETINQSIREGAKKSKKSKKGGSKSKKKNKGHHKGSKKGSKGGGKRHRVKSIESQEEEEFELEGPIPIPLPNPIIDSPEIKESDNPTDEMESSGGLHILDVLRTPMIPDYESPPPEIRAEPLVGLDYRESSTISSSTTSNNNDYPKNMSLNASSSISSSTISGNPPSGRANMNKGQGYLKFDKYEGSGTTNMSGAGMQKQQREKQRNERDPMDSFHNQHVSDADLQVQESISHAHIVPSPFSMKTETGLAPSQYQFQQQQPLQQQITKSNNELSLSSAPQQVSLTQNYSPTGKSVSTLSEANGFRHSHPNGKNDFVSKYPTTFVYQSNSPSGPPPPGSRPYMSPSPPGLPPNNVVMYGSPPPPSLSSRPPFRMNKLRPNLHSYYDSSYHNYAGMGESQAASEMIGIRHPYGPPHFKPPPHAMYNPMPLPSPPRFVNGYGNRPGFMMMPYRGTHYVGHTHNVASLPNEPITNPNDEPVTDYQQDLTGNGHSDNNNENSSVGNQDIGGSDATGIGSDNDNIDQYTLSEVDNNAVTAAENSETKKVGIMESFDVFYKEYKILTWVAVFFVTSMALFTLLVYLYINNPPTEVVQARQLFPWNDLLKNPQITKFLSSIMESSGGTKKRKKDDDDEYLKPYGKGFGGKSGKQKRKQTRTQQDRNKFINRVNKIKRLNQSDANIGNNSTVVPSSIVSKKNN